MESDRFLHFCTSNRALALGQHKAFVQGIEKHVLDVFQYIEKDGEDFIKQEYKRLCSAPGWEDGPDCADLAELAQARGQEHFDNLLFVKGQMMNLATAGLYHLWERTLKSFLEREAHFFSEKYFGEDPKKTIQQADFLKIRNWLKEWNFCEHQDAKTIMEGLHTLSLVSNTIKHGAGSSCEKLFKKDPGFFKGPYPELSPVLFDKIKKIPPFDQANPDDLWITPEKFHELSGIVEQFWEALPEQIKTTNKEKTINIILSLRVMQRMFDQEISMDEIHNTLKKNNVIEDDPDNTHYSIRLMLGHVKNCKPFHVVVAENSEEKRKIIITVYHPNPTLWLPDWSTRRNRP
ncbi:DUF4258 domain-containing protein [Candidatus Magnetaquiglobus chichijimensis]